MEEGCVRWYGAAILKIRERSSFVRVWSRWRGLVRVNGADDPLMHLRKGFGLFFVLTAGRGRGEGGEGRREGEIFIHWPRPPGVGNAPFRKIFEFAFETVIDTVGLIACWSVVKRRTTLEGRTLSVWQLANTRPLVVIHCSSNVIHA